MAEIKTWDAVKHLECRPLRHVKMLSLKSNVVA